jgi:hypothetical protein
MGLNKATVSDNLTKSQKKPRHPFEIAKFISLARKGPQIQPFVAVVP